MKLIIAIDGPAGSGKSTVARLLSERLGYSYLETGAMYRAVALLAQRRGIASTDAAALEALARDADMKFVPGEKGNRLLLGGEDVTDIIRSPEITTAASIVSAIPGVRQALVKRQREMGRDGGVIMEGRDIGTKVFPAAQVKVFLDASPEVRGERRLQQAGGSAAHTETAADMAARDARDRERAASPLAAAPDAVHLDSSSMSAEQVLQAILRLVEQRSKR